MLDSNHVCYLSCTIVFVCQEKETKPTKTSQSSKLKVNNYFNENGSTHLFWPGSSKAEIMFKAN